MSITLGKRDWKTWMRMNDNKQTQEKAKLILPQIDQRINEHFLRSREHNQHAQQASNEDVHHHNVGIETYVGTAHPFHDAGTDLQ